MKTTLVKKFENYKESEGTIHTMLNENDCANQARKEETDIKQIIAKYGIIPAELIKTAKDPLYLDMRGTEYSVNEMLQRQEQVADYFETLPAKIRVKYNGNPMELYNALITGDYRDMVQDGILTENHKEELELIRTQKDRQIQEKENQIKQMYAELENLKGESNEKTNND